MKKLLWAFLAFMMLLCALFTGIILMYGNDKAFAEALRKFSHSDKPHIQEIAKVEEPLIEDQEEPEEEIIEDVPVQNESGLIDAPIDYIEPSDYDLSIPDDVKGLSGLGDIDFTAITISDEEAERIEKEVPIEPTGDGLDFDPKYYPYYSFLDDQGKHLYRQMYAHIVDNSPSFQSVERDISETALENVFFAVTYDHPELFWLSNGYSGRYTHNGEILELDLMFNQTASNLESSQAQFDEAVNSIVSAAQGSDYEKERFVHDELARRFLYQFNSLDQSAYSGLVNNTTVCVGYAKAYSRILTLLNIPCYVCVGHAGEPHAWSIVCLEGDYYNVDVTWDDTERGRGFNYNYFNKTDDDYGTSHIRQELSVYLPPCNGTKYRNLEPDEEETEEAISPDPVDQPDTSLESTGYSEDDMIRSVDDYYNRIRDKLNENGRGNYTVKFPITKEALDACNAAYDNGDFQNNVTDPYANDNDVSVSIGFVATQVNDDCWIMENTISVY